MNDGEEASPDIQATAPALLHILQWLQRDALKLALRNKQRVFGYHVTQGIYDKASPNSSRAAVPKANKGIKDKAKKNRNTEKSSATGSLQRKTGSTDRQA